MELRLSCTNPPICARDDVIQKGRRDIVPLTSVKLHHLYLGRAEFIKQYLVTDLVMWYIAPFWWYLKLRRSAVYPIGLLDMT